MSYSRNKRRKAIKAFRTGIIPIQHRDGRKFPNFQMVNGVWKQCVEKTNIKCGRSRNPEAIL